jgi:hypothetical protein
MVCRKWNFRPVMHEELWTEYLMEVAAIRDEAIRVELARYRFSLLYRAGRDADWVRSYRLYGVPPVQDD